MRIYSWNVNGIRAVYNKGAFSEFIEKISPDVLCIQETKAQLEQLSSEIVNIDGYTSYFYSAAKKGYSGVAVYSKYEPIAVRGMGVEEFDLEGRYIELEFEDFTLINCYFPNSQALGKRIQYKLDFCKALKEIMDKYVELGKNVVLCGDYNIAHNEIDLKNHKTNHKNPGFLPEERSWMESYLTSGYIDTFRYFNPSEEKYSWWSYRQNARENNVGWRIDYFSVNEAYIENVVDCGIDNDIHGSDHCPVFVELGSV